MIYTSYFDNLKNLPSDVIPISIAGKAPDWYNGLEYKKLAPKWKFFQEWKKNKDNNFYIKCFYEQVLYQLKQEQVHNDLYKMVGGRKNIALICYEKPNEFCHRHLVAEWLSPTIKEYIGKEEKQ